MATESFEKWVDDQVKSHTYLEIRNHYDEAAFWVTAFIFEVGSRENESCDYDNDDIEKGILFNEVVTEFFDDSQ